MVVVVASPRAAVHPQRRCSSIIDGTGSVEKLTDVKANRAASSIDAFACEALRTLCLAYQDVTSGSDIPNHGYTLIGCSASRIRVPGC